VESSDPVDTDATDASGTDNSGNDAGDTDASRDENTDGTGDGATSPDADADSDTGGKPSATLPAGAVDELIIEDIVVGDGDLATPGSMVEVHYVGVLACGGSEFDSSWSRDTTFSFLLGGQRVIYGWDAGVEGMRVGGQRQLTIPSYMGYGERGSGGSIPPGADLVFVVDLVGVDPDAGEVTELVPPVAAEAANAVDGEPVPTLPPGPVVDLIVEDITVGDGAVAAQDKIVEVNYVGVLACNGQKFDSSFERGSTFSFSLGNGQVIQGWDQGVDGMAEGGRRQLTIPATQAYGPGGSGIIPANADLVFVVDVVSVTDPLTEADQPAFEIPDELSGELEITDLVVGEGAEVMPGDNVEVQFVAQTLSDGIVLDSTWANGGVPIVLTTAEGSLPGLAQGIPGVKVGGTRQILIPPALAFGEEGGNGIGPNETIAVIIEVLSIP